MIEVYVTFKHGLEITVIIHQHFFAISCDDSDESPQHTSHRGHDRNKHGMDATATRLKFEALGASKSKLQHVICAIEEHVDSASEKEAPQPPQSIHEYLNAPDTDDDASDARTRIYESYSICLNRTDRFIENQIEGDGERRCRAGLCAQPVQEGGSEVSVTLQSPARMIDCSGRRACAPGARRRAAPKGHTALLRAQKQKQQPEQQLLEPTGDHYLQVNNNEADEEPPYDADILNVQAQIQMDTNQLYAKLLNGGGEPFDVIYPPANDNPLIQEQEPMQQEQEKKKEHQPSCDDEGKGHVEQRDGQALQLPGESKNIGPVFSYGKKWPDHVASHFKHLKQEMMNNPYSPITEKTWNGILKKCDKILKGEFSSQRKNRWSKLLRENKIGMKHLVALKLYTDFDLLQREFRKSFRAPFNRDRKRLQAFVHWRDALQETFAKFSGISDAYALSQPKTLFHGINSVMCLDQYAGQYSGPCSTTTDLHVARSFAGKNGMILVIKPLASPFKVLDISWISDYPDEREFLLFDHCMEIQTWVLSSDYDQYYHYYHNTLTKGKLQKGPPGHRSFQQQVEIPRHLNNLQLLIGREAAADGRLKENVEFKLDKVSQPDKLALLLFIFRFALEFKFGRKKPSKFDQTLDANLQHVLKSIHEMRVPPALARAFVEQVHQAFKKDMPTYFIRTVLNEYFACTYCPLDASATGSSWV